MRREESLLPSERIKLFHTEQRIVLESGGNQAQVEYDRQTGNLTVHARQIGLKGFKEEHFYGLLGSVQLSNKYLVLIKSRVLNALLEGSKKVYKVTRVEFFGVTSKHLSEESRKSESSYLKALEKLFSKQDFYFSYEYDITNTLQRMESDEYALKCDLPLYLRADERFFWNHFISAELRENKLHSFIVLVMRGGLHTFTYVLDSSACSIELISRRSRHRAGTRYRTRGIDEDGHVANYVETEQRLFCRNQTTSLVQTRGSVPLFWEQTGRNYRPTPKIISRDHVCQKFSLF